MANSIGKILSQDSQIQNPKLAESPQQERSFRFSLTGFEIKGHSLQEEETLMKRVWRFYVLEFLAAIFLVIAAIYLKEALWIAAIPAIGSTIKSRFSKQPP